MSNLLKLWSISSLSILVLLLSSTSSRAAESIVLRYKVLRATIPITDLAQLANRGQVSPALSTYLKLAGANPQDVQRVLGSQIKVNPKIMEMALTSQVGDIVLEKFAQVFSSSSGDQGESLKTALLNSAQDGELSLIETLVNYPQPEVNVEGERLVEVYNHLKTFTGKIPIADIIKILRSR